LTAEADKTAMLALIRGEPWKYECFFSAGRDEPRRCVEPVILTESKVIVCM
jgi:hypothetical protein